MGINEVPMVHVAGGLSRDPWWQRLFADVVGSPVSAPCVAENGALGAAIAAASGAGMHVDIDSAVDAMVTPGAAVMPSSDRATSYFDRRYARYAELDTALRAWSQE